MSKRRAGVDASPTTSERWVWELIQNAKDVNINGKIRVKIEADLNGASAQLTFSHNGAPFSPENTRFLIEQVSSKERTNYSNGRPTSKGRFGTAFLTTHLLSERVVVNGVEAGKGFPPKKFKLTLDRSGTEIEDIIKAVEVAQASILDLYNEPDFTAYAPGKFNTSFRYELADKTGKQVASAGLTDLDICLPCTLAFVPELAAGMRRMSELHVTLLTAMETLSAEVLNYMDKLPEGTPVAAKELLHLGGRAAVDQALSRLVRRGELMRAARGLYIRPSNGRFGAHPPEASKVVEALAAQRGERVARHGAMAANELGLTTQVPMREVYLTSGKSRSLQLGAQLIELRHVPEWQLVLPGHPAGAAIRALAWLGPKRAGAALRTLRQELPTAELQAMVGVRGRLPTWMAEEVSALANGG